MVSYARQEVLLRQRRMGPSKCCASRRRIFNGISHRNQMMSARRHIARASPVTHFSRTTGTENEGRDNDEKCDYPSHLSRMRATQRGEDLLTVPTYSLGHALTNAWNLFTEIWSIVVIPTCPTRHCLKFAHGFIKKARCRRSFALLM